MKGRKANIHWALLLSLHSYQSALFKEPDWTTILSVLILKLLKQWKNFIPEVCVMYTFFKIAALLRCTSWATQFTQSKYTVQRFLNLRSHKLHGHHKAGTLLHWCGCLRVLRRGPVGLESWPRGGAPQWLVVWYCASRAVSVGNLQLELTSRDDCTARVKKRYLWAPSAEPFLTETGRYWGVSLTPAVLQPSL